MSQENANNNAGGLAGVNSSRLFFGSCLALISTSVAFGVVTSMMGDFKTAFALSNTEAGLIGGAALWGFTITVFIFGPLCDVLGMRRLMWFSLVCHLIGPLLMIFANGFQMLFAGALVIALANGTVEAVCNPLVTTIFPDKKTQKLNQFHVWFPGGIVIGGLLAFFMDKLGDEFWASMPMESWQAKLALVLIPTVLYGIIFLGQKFPPTERVQSGLSFGDMARATLLRPLFLVLFVCMGITATLELGPGRWMGEVMNSAMDFAGDNSGILVLVYGSGLMAILRFFAGPVVNKLSPTGLLVCSAVLSGVGLFALTMVSGPMIIIAATVFYVGVCYFWPTMLGVAAERVPKGGAMAMGLLGGWGMAVVGLVSVPIMGFITDAYGHDELPLEDTTACIQAGTTFIEELKASEDAADFKNLEEDYVLVKAVNDEIASSGEMPKGDTSKALRTIAMYAADEELGDTASGLIGPADEYGGIWSFRWISALSIVLILVFGCMYIKDRAAGGYKAEDITA